MIKTELIYWCDMCIYRHRGITARATHPNTPIRMDRNTTHLDLCDPHHTELTTWRIVVARKTNRRNAAKHPRPRRVT